MDKLIQRIYIAVLLALAALLTYYFVRYRDVVETSAPKMGSELLTAVPTADSPELVTGENGWTGRIHIDGVTGKYCHLIFYTIHQTVEVYHGAECIYSMSPSPKNTFAKTPGCVWNDILLTEDVNGADLYLKLTPTYPNLTFGLPDFYLGEKGSIVKVQLGKELFSVIVSLILIAVGISFAGYVFYNRKNSEVDKSLALLGLLASQVGLYRVADSSLSKMLFHGLPIVSLMPFIALMMVTIPFVLFMKGLYTTKDFKIWYVPCWLSLGIMALALFLQFFNIVDFREILKPIFAVLLLGIGVVFVMAIVEVRRSGFNAKLRSNLLGMLLVAMGVSFDAGTYYFTNGRRITAFVILGFLLYAIALAVTLFKESGALITAGKGAHSMENLAYHDKLTGVYNRAAFIVDTDPYVVDPENYAVAVLDLNNLKYCNDHLGHEVGDQYIRDASEIIKNTFGTIGSCYRMGGDEFYILIPKGGKAAAREQQETMDKMVEEYNQKNTTFKMGIACGYARFDNRIDYDLNSTAKRADQLMYQNKEEMKSMDHQEVRR
ncbi:MAG: GGDEF domain-containing protein [Lachnospiraceae bacterium]|nr:GGDEF domain-containing protein [Lachnospiraceae bacterium]